MSDQQENPKRPRVSRAAAKLSDNLGASDSKPASKSNATSIAAAVAGGCFLITVLLVISAPSILGWMFRGLSYNPEPIIESTNAPIAQGFLAEVADYAPTVSRFENWTLSVWAYGMNCPDAGDPNGDSCYYAESLLAAKSDDENACREAFEIAKNFGVESDVVIGEIEGKPFGAESLDRCLTMLSSYPRSVGWGWFGPEYYIKGTTDEGVPWVMLLTRSQQTSAEASTNNKNGKLNPEEYGYNITIGTDFGDAYSGENEGPKYDQNKVQAAAMLDTIAYYRRSNKPLGFFTKALVDQVLPIYKEIFRFDGSVKSFADSDGSIHWVQMNFMDGVTWCVSIGEGKDLTTGGDETLGMGMDETGLPGGTVELAGLGKAVESRAAAHKFGDYIVGECK